MTERIKHWRVYDARNRAFVSRIPPCATRAEAERRATALTAGKRDNRTNVLRMALAVIPVLEDGTSPRAAEWQAYYDELLSDED